MLNNYPYEMKISVTTVCGREKGKPPGAMRSAPLIRTGMTADGVERNGSRSVCFHNVYTEMGE